MNTSIGALVLFLVLVAGCSDGAEPFVIVESGGGVVATQTVDAAGGDIVTFDGAMTVTIDPGTFGEPTEVTVRTNRNFAVSPALTDLGIETSFSIHAGQDATAPYRVTVRSDGRPEAGLSVFLPGSENAPGGEPGLIGDRVVWDLAQNQGITQFSVAQDDQFFLAGGNPEELQGTFAHVAGLRVRVELDPGDPLDTGTPFTPTITVQPPLDLDLSPGDVVHRDRSAAEGGAVEYTGPAEVTLANPAALTGYRCGDVPGGGLYVADLVMANVEFGGQTSSFTIEVSAPVTCEGDAAEPRVFQFVAKPEGMFLLPGGSFGLTERGLVIVGGGGFVIVTDIEPGGAPAVVFRRGGEGFRYNTVAAAGNRIQTTGPDGRGITNYIPEESRFGATLLGVFGVNHTDVTAYGGEWNDDGMLVVSFQQRQVRVDDLQNTGGFLLSDSFPNDPPIASFRREATGGALIATDGQPGELLFVADFGGSAPVKIADLGNGSRRVVELDGVIAITNEDDDTIMIGLWDELVDSDVTITDTVTVGDGPITASMRKLADGRLVIATNGFNDNTYTLTVVDPATGIATVSQTFALAKGSSDISAVLWLDDSTLAVSSNGTDETIFVPVTIPDPS